MNLRHSILLGVPLFTASILSEGCTAARTAEGVCLDATPHGLPGDLDALRIQAVAEDGDGGSVCLSSQDTTTIDSDGVILIRFDNKALQDKVEADLTQAIQDVDRLLQLLQQEKAELDAQQVPTTPVEQGLIRRAALDEVASSLSGFSLEVVARRTTPSNAESQLVIPYWTDGKAPEVKPGDLPNRIKQLVDELKSKAKDASEQSKKNEEAAKNLAPNNPGVQAFVDLQGRDSKALDNSVAQDKNTQDREATLDNIRRGLLAFLPDARIDARRSGLERGDALAIALEFHHEAPAGPAPAADAAPKTTTPAPKDDELVGVVEYHTQVDDLGWEPHVRSQLIFFRSTSGTSDERDWKANAAGLVEWSYRFPESDNAWKTFLNVWEPGIGIHVASVDQGDASVEVGTGVNVSLFRGLVSAGWGYNLSESDHYYFLGGDLFKLFDSIKDLAK